MIVVTGGAGFIGSNLVRALNARGQAGIVVVDDLGHGEKFRNLVDCEILDYRERRDFLREVQADRDLAGTPEAVFHLGACTDTRERDARYMMETNYEYSRLLLEWCLRREVPFIYASSGAVYGTGSIFREERQFESPLNAYGYSKFLFDQHVRRLLPTAASQVCGLRYFNVYGPREAHKGPMASVVWHFHNQLLERGRVRLFAGSGGYGDGEQRRDFVFVEDAVAVNLWFLEHPEESGIFNVGTGRSRAFNDVAQAVIDWHGRGAIEYIPFPPGLQGRYQSNTEADLSALREAGFDDPFTGLEQGVARYLEWLGGVQGGGP